MNRHAPSVASTCDAASEARRALAAGSDDQSSCTKEMELMQ